MNIIKQSLGAVTLGAIFAGFAVSDVNAAVFTFERLSGETDVVNNGDILYAWGGNGNINGISFNTTTNSDNVSVAFRGWGGCGGDFSNQFTGGLNSVLSSCFFQPGSSSVFLDFIGLTIGEEYTLQLLWSNTLGNNVTGERGRVTMQGNSLDYSAPAFTNNAYIATSTFTAGATTEIATFGNGSAAGQSRFLLNGFVLSGTPTAEPEIPLPSAIALLGLGFASLVTLRKS